MVTQMALPIAVKALGVRHSPCQGRVIWNLSANQASCFAAGTPIRTPDGSKLIDEIVVGDRVLARDEFDPEAPVVACRVEEVFIREGLIWELRVGGQTIRTTAEHPHYILGRGWVACQELCVGDRVLTELGTALPVEALKDTGSFERLYNFRVAEAHTYFVGAPEWGFAVWVHNDYHHIVSKYKNLGRGFSRPWTVMSQLILKNAGIGLNSKTNFRSINPHQGPHPELYHQRVNERLQDAVAGHAPRSPGYQKAVKAELDRIHADIAANPIDRLQGIGL